MVNPDRLVALFNRKIHSESYQACLLFNINWQAINFKRRANELLKINNLQRMPKSKNTPKQQQQFYFTDRKPKTAPLNNRIQAIKHNTIQQKPDALGPANYYWTLFFCFR